MSSEISSRRRRITSSLAHLGLMCMGAWAALFSAGVLHEIPALAVDSFYPFFIAAILLVVLLVYNRQYLKQIFLFH